MWDLPKEPCSWATAGYMGAISTGQTTCGLLIGCSIALGLQCGNGKAGVPEEHASDRDTAIEAVESLYRDFLKRFGSTDCRTLSVCDYSNSEDIARRVQNEEWKDTCDIFLKFVMTKCIEMAQENRI
ncbi:MAG: C_GCAxxG_C_C family protein [Deltaproteobacteria bacterium]|nr:C_GCAxxG_C_C family protein [Deltaproteobacteria bacterium]